MKVLVINSGSSSIKYQLFDMPAASVLAAGAVERIGEPEGVHKQRLPDSTGSMHETQEKDCIHDHREGLVRIGTRLRDSGVIADLSQLSAIGHRVVHGGELFRAPTRITADVLERIRAMIPLAPLHNPANIMGIEVSLQQAPDIPQVAVFDTAFHQSIPDYAWRYAIPQRLYAEHHVRRYGFHGTSHRYVARQAAAYLDRALESLNLITLHLGNGASAAAIAGGRSVDTSMGMTPLEGLVMGTRCGDIDPAVHFYLGRVSGMGNAELESLFNKESGLKGICGANDMREVHRLIESGEDDARLALDMYCYRIRKYIGAYYAVLGRVDAVVFTAGIGENDALVRERVCMGLEGLGICIDPEKNAGGCGTSYAIHREPCAVSVLVVATDEELEIAQQTVECIRRAA